MIKIVIFDADGMIVKRVGRFHDRYAEAFNIQPGKLAGFFSHEFQDCVIGKKDLKVELKKNFPNGGGKSRLMSCLPIGLKESRRYMRQCSTV